MAERRAQRLLLDEPGERERDDRDRHAPQEDAVERVREGSEELLVDDRRQLCRLGGVDTNHDTRRE